MRLVPCGCRNRCTPALALSGGCGHQPSSYLLPPAALQFAGYSEEVLDVRFLGPEDSHVIVASNSPCLKVFELQTSACQILHGHTGEWGQPT